MSKTLQLTQVVEVEPPKSPNFLRVKGRKSGIPVGDFSDEQLEGYAEAYKAGLINRARDQRAAAKGGD